MDRRIRILDAKLYVTIVFVWFSKAHLPAVDIAGDKICIFGMLTWIRSWTFFLMGNAGFSRGAYTARRCVFFPLRRYFA